MQKLPSLRTGSNQGALDNENDWNESQRQIILALMTRKIGSPVEFQRFLDTSFNSSVAGLTDSVGWNDFDSFRLLAKVLACVPGLERDAQIALSCQFSITDSSVDQGDSDASSETKSGTIVPDEVQPGTTPGAASNEQVNMQQDQSSNTQSGSADEERAITRTTKITIDKKPGTSKPVIMKEVQLTDSRIAASGNDEDEEDLTPEDSRWMYCDSDCNKEDTNWKGVGPVYFCVQCSNCDLCEDCYKVSDNLHNWEAGLLNRRFY